MEHSKWAPAPAVDIVNKHYPSKLGAVTNIPSKVQSSVAASRVSPNPEATPFVLPAAPPAPPAISSLPPAPFDEEEFAQTRAPDDLFSDDFEPIEEQAVPQPVRSAPVRSTPARNPAAQPATATGAAPVNGQAAGTEAPRTAAVRGDRSGTGGVKKTKLTEGELSARIEAIRLKDEERRAAHARSEADKASFAEREAVDQAKREVERQSQLRMASEREANRARKLRALGGREWDAEKQEDHGVGADRGSQYRRGAHGGVGTVERSSPADTKAGLLDFLGKEDEARIGGGRGGRGGRGRGRGGPGMAGRPADSPRGGRGRGGASTRGGREAGPGEQSAPTQGDFPELEPGKPVVAATPTKLTFPINTAVGKKSQQAVEKTTPPLVVDGKASPPQETDGKAPLPREADGKTSLPRKEVAKTAPAQGAQRRTPPAKEKTTPRQPTVASQQQPPKSADFPSLPPGEKGEPVARPAELVLPVHSRPPPPAAKKSANAVPTAAAGGKSSPAQKLVASTSKPNASEGTAPSGAAKKSWADQMDN